MLDLTNLEPFIVVIRGKQSKFYIIYIQTPLPVVAKEICGLHQNFLNVQNVVAVDIPFAIIKLQLILHES